MSRPRATLPAYVRLPDGLRFSGTARFTDSSRLAFWPKQAISPLPPEGLPVTLIVAGLPDNDETQISVTASIDSADARELVLEPDRELPDALIAALAPDSVIWLPSPAEAEALIDELYATGLDTLRTALRRFVVDLGDELFDLSTSSKFGISGQHAHYDALNMLKKHSEHFQKTFVGSVQESLAKAEKETDGQTFADLEAASARTLNLVALDEMDQKLAVDKLINAQIDRHRVALECLTIRAALVADLEPRRARTPFHPAFIVQAFVDAFGEVSDSTVVLIDALAFFRDRYLPLLDSMYPSLNKLLVDAGIEPGLEDDIRENGSLLNPVEKRIIKSTVRSRHRGDQDGGDRGDGDSAPPEDGQHGEIDDAPAAPDGTPAAADSPRQARPDHFPTSRNKHDAMYDAIVSALDTNRGARESATPAGTETRRTGAGTAAATADGDTAPAASDGTAAAPSPALSPDELLRALEKLQGTAAAVSSLAELTPLAEMVRQDAGGGMGLERNEANRLGFIDNVYRTLHKNFEVSADMAPSLARLRVPLARLSLQEPRFFTQPDHPAHQLLDKISRLSSVDHTVNRALRVKINDLVERVARNYRDDSSVFASAQGELDELLAQKDSVLERNIERVIAGLEGQERLTRAQRRVEDLLDSNLKEDDAPQPLLELLDGGWRSALVQLALREGEDSVAWQEEAALLEQLVTDLRQADRGELADAELREMRLRLRALNQRLGQSNPGSVAHERALRKLAEVLAGELPLATTSYSSPLDGLGPPDRERVEQLPRLRRWLKRVQALEPGARLRYRDRDGRRRQMRLIWVSEDRDRFAFVNERGQKIAELTAIQLARQLSRGARPASNTDDMSVLDQSMYETLEQAQKTLSFERNRDRVTHLINGESLLMQLRRTLRHAAARDSEHAFLLLDIDNFKLVNEIFDDTSGDEVLAEFARLLAQLNDRRALTARIEKDRFGILLTYRPLEDARRIAEKIRGDIAAGSLTIGQEAVSFTVSIGIAPIVQASPDAEKIIEQAADALSLAKSQGRDQVVVYDFDRQEVHRYRTEREASKRQLEEAMSTDGLALRAQPIVQSAIDGSQGASHHYEILLALRARDGELTSPQDFIRSAERFGYVTLVDRWVLRETFTWISSLVDRQKQIPELSINLSGTSITDDDFLDYVLEQISEYGVGTSRLCFEITETGAIDNLPKAADFVRTLRNIGCKFSLDDFGTGLASHKYLRELPVDYVKIDGTFISDVHENSTDFAMAKSINDLAHFLGQRTIAECVESLDIVPALREIGIDYLQGWGVGMPRALEEIVEELPDLET